MQITVIAGGHHAAGHVAALRDHLSGPDDALTVVLPTSGDAWLFGLRTCPDIDVTMRVLADDADPSGEPSGETYTAHAELARFAVPPTWARIGDRALATHLLRTQMLAAGYPLSQVTAALARNQGVAATVLPVTDDRVELHVTVEQPSADAPRVAVHLQEYAARGTPDASGITRLGLDTASPAPGVVEALHGCDVVVVAPADPVAAVGSITAVPGVSEALRATSAPVVGISPVSAGVAAPGTAPPLLAAAGATVDAWSVAGLLGDVLDGWVVDPGDARHGSTAGPVETTADLRSASEAVDACLALATELRRR